MTIKEIFDRMDYGPAPEGNAEAKAWLAKHAATFGHFLDGTFTKPGATFATKNPANGSTLAGVTQGTAADIDAAVAAARRPPPEWARLPRRAPARPPPRPPPPDPPAHPPPPAAPPQATKHTADHPTHP